MTKNNLTSPAPFIMMKSIFLVFGLLIVGTTSYSDMGQIESINHTQVKNDTEKTAQPIQPDQKETGVSQAAARKRATGKIIGIILSVGIILGFIIGTIVALGIGALALLLFP
jgi:hypothetical protein